MKEKLKRNVKWIGLTIWVGLSFGIKAQQQNAALPLSLGQVAPSFTIKDVEGNNINLADYKGKK
jgi:hypothetical protein